MLVIVFFSLQVSVGQRQDESLSFDSFLCRKGIECTVFRPLLCRWEHQGRPNAKSPLPRWRLGNGKAAALKLQPTSPFTRVPACGASGVSSGPGSKQPPGGHQQRGCRRVLREADSQRVCPSSGSLNLAIATQYFEWKHTPRKEGDFSHC